MIYLMTYYIMRLVLCKLTTLVSWAAVVGPVERLAAGPRLALLLQARHLAVRTLALLARVRSWEIVSRDVDHVSQSTASWNIKHYCSTPLAHFFIVYRVLAV